MTELVYILAVRQPRIRLVKNMAAQPAAISPIITQ